MKTKIGLILASFVIASGFTAPGSEALYGQGTLEVVPSANDKYKKYLTLDEPLAFAVSEDGRVSSGSFCQQPGTCLDINGPQLAIDQCNATSTRSPCKLFAIGRDVVWNGRIRLKSDLGTLKSDVGTGPVSLNLAVEQKFQRYSNLAEPLAFAVSVDGQRSSGSFCQQPGTCQDTDGPALAIRQCNISGGANGALCKTFAIGRDIVWDGLVSWADIPVPTPSPQPLAPPPSIAPPAQTPPAEATPPSTSSRLRSSKAFRDLEEDIRRTQAPPPVNAQ